MVSELKTLSNTLGTYHAPLLEQSGVKGFQHFLPCAVLAGEGLAEACGAPAGQHARRLEPRTGMRD